MKLSHRDELLLQRHLDGELDPGAAASFTMRLAAEPALRSAADEAWSLRAGFTGARVTGMGTGMRPSPAFTANVLAAARQLPTRQQLEQADVAAGAIGWCRRLLLAAAVVAGIGGLWYSGLIHDEQPVVLEASPGEVQRETERLDAMVNAGQVPPASADERRGR